MDTPLTNPWQPGRFGGAASPGSSPAGGAPPGTPPSPMGMGAQPPKPPSPPPPPPPKPAWPSAPPPAPAGPKLPDAPPKATLEVRTMGSDLKSIGRGDTMPIPESVMAPEAKREIVFSPETQNQMAGVPSPRKLGPSVPPMMEEEPPSGKRKLLMWGGGIAAVVVLGAVGYFVAYPRLFPPSPPPAPPPPPPPALAPHVSYFLTPATTKGKVSVTAIEPAIISLRLQQLRSTPLPPGSLQEVEIAHDATGQVPWSAFFATFGTNLAAADLAAWFEDDFTAFAYYDVSGVWPGYVAKLKSGVTADAIRQGLALLESSDLAPLYLFPPGDPQGGWNDGGVNGTSARYLVYAQPSAAFSYTVFDSYVLFSTSYEGAKGAATLLGY